MADVVNPVAGALAASFNEVSTGSGLSVRLAGMARPRQDWCTTFILMLATGHKVMRVMRTAALAALIGLTVGVSGCGGGGGRPETHPVAGVVTFNGEPVADAMVTFHLEDGGAPRPAMGKTDSNGKFRLTTFDTNDGAMAGRHVVTVVKEESTGDDGGEMEIGSDSYAAAMSAAAAGTNERKLLVPEKYATKAESPLRITVDAGGRDDVEIILESD